MNYSISKHFSRKDIFLFTIPSILTMLFTSLYTIVDGIFVSRFVGSDALSSVNIVLPAINLITGIGIMMGTGGSAVIGKKLGEQKTHEARQSFTFLIAVTSFSGVICSAAVVLAARPLAEFLGASPQLMEYCVSYLRMYAMFFLASILQILFQMLLVTAGQPNAALILTVIAGLSNILLDYIFMVPLQMGITGAALGTGISCLIGSIPPCLYFLKKHGILHFTRFHFEKKTLFQSMSNGSSEMVSSVASGIIVFLFNQAMMQIAGEQGVAAMSIVMYTQFLFAALHLGFSTGIAPVFSYHYGDGNRQEVKSLFLKCLSMVLIGTIVVVGAAFILAETVVGIFAGSSRELYEMSLHGYRIFIWNFLFSGFNVFASSLFTALSNGLISAAISFLRTFAAQVAAILILPLFLGIDGLWLAVPAAELLSSLFSLYCIIKYFAAVYLFKSGR